MFPYSVSVVYVSFVLAGAWILAVQEYLDNSSWSWVDDAYLSVFTGHNEERAVVTPWSTQRYVRQFHLHDYFRCSNVPDKYLVVRT